MTLADRALLRAAKRGAFAERVSDKRKLVVLTTSAHGSEKLPAVDAVPSASEFTQAPSDANSRLARTEAVLAKRGKPNAQTASKRD